jgi:hypothetical protein
MSLIGTQNFVPKLKAHLLSRVKQSLGLDTESRAHVSGDTPLHVHESDEGRGVLIKNDCMYKHRLFRINYTTYDVRRDQDVINPGTPHYNIMMLADPVSDEGALAVATCHNFLYARVLGIYHVNIIYVGPGMVDYHPRRFDFLWVRWYQLCTTGHRRLYRLDQLSFPPVTNQDAFGFVDPANVVRSCHLIPRFASGRRFPIHQGDGDDSLGLSPCGHDNHDWNRYYVNWYVLRLGYPSSRLKHRSPRFVDRDMLMRYHLGLGVGHIHSHPSEKEATTQGDFPDSDNKGQSDQWVQLLNGDDDGEHGLEERENENLQTYSDEQDEDGEGDIDDETLWASHEMYETEVI